MMELYVIRHGEVDVNKKGLANGRNSSKLTKEGIKQAGKASNKIKELNIDLIICSPLLRTKQTCKLININNVTVIYDDRILERDTKSTMNMDMSKIDLEYFYNTENEIVFEDCEGFKSILKRTSIFIEDLKSKYMNKSILIVTHHDVCKAIYSYIYNSTNVKDIISFSQKNCEIKKYIL